MACLARTATSRASCLSLCTFVSSSSCSSCRAAKTSKWASLETSVSTSKMHRMYRRARFINSLSCQTLKQSWRCFEQCNSSNKSVASSALAFRKEKFCSSTVISPTVTCSRQTQFLCGSNRLCSSSSPGNLNRNWKHSTAVIRSNSADAGSSVASSSATERRRSQNFDRLACPGCGVYMQDRDPKGPGFFKMPAAVEKVADDFDESEEFEGDNGEIEREDDLEEFDDEVEEEQEVREGVFPKMEVPDWASVEDDDKEEIDLREDGFEEWNELGGSKQVAKDAWKEILGRKKHLKEDGVPDAPEEEEKLVVCARCHALRNYGKVKDESLENLLPDFDFERAVGTRLKKAFGRRAVVLMVVDGSDFDGSFPRRAAAVLAEAERDMGTAWQEGKSGNTPRLLLVLNKIDLLPRQVSPKRLEQWVRRRAKAGGAPRLTGVHLVSAFNGWGVEKLAEHVKELAGARGDAWVVGAQNAGKSSLINSLAKFAGEGRRSTHLTEAAVPGTTLGVLKLEGILPNRARLFDTPGLLHPHQITTRLNREEQKLVQVRKELKPRTFRVKKGSTVHVGGLLRLDVVDAPSESIYMTVWASAQVPCHMGKAEKADELFEKHIGDRLKPPMDKERAAELGRWVARSVSVTGNSWDNSSVDVAVAGLGWVGIGVKGTAGLQAWTYEGVAVTTHEAMVYDMAHIFEKPGFTAMKAPSKSGKKSNDKAKGDRVKEMV